MKQTATHYNFCRWRPIPLTFNYFACSTARSLQINSLIITSLLWVHSNQAWCSWTIIVTFVSLRRSLDNDDKWRIHVVQKNGVYVSFYLIKQCCFNQSSDWVIFVLSPLFLLLFILLTASLPLILGLYFCHSSSRCASMPLHILPSSLAWLAVALIHFNHLPQIRHGAEV